MNKNIYTEDNIFKALLKLSITGVISIFISELYNMVDTIFVGKYVGASAIGSLSVIFPVQRLIIALSICYSVGVSNLISRKIGEKRIKEISQYTQSVVMLTIISILLVNFFVVLFNENICFFLGARDEILELSIRYLRITIFGSLFLSLTNIFGYINIAFGKIKVMLFSISIGALINIVFDYLLVYKFGLSVEGAAIATVFSQIVSFMISIYFVKKLQKNEKFIIRPKMNFKIFFRIFAVGFSSFIIEFSDAILITVLNYILLPIGGNDSIILVGVITKTSMFMFVTVIGISSSIQPLLSYNYGAKNYKKIKKIILEGFLLIFTTSTLLWAVMYINAEKVISIFLKEDRLIHIAVKNFRIVIIAFPVLSFYYLCIYLFQSVGKEKYNFILSIYRETLLYIPILIITVKNYGVIGAWISYPISDIIASLTSLYLLYKIIKKIDKSMLIKEGGKNE